MQTSGGPGQGEQGDGGHSHKHGPAPGPGPTPGPGPHPPVPPKPSPVEQMKCFAKFGAYTIPIIAIITWAVGISYCGYIGGGWNYIVYGDFATHPTLMLTAFLLVGSFSVVCQQFLRHVGVECKKTRQNIQLILNTLVMIFAWMGWWVIYELHAEAGSHYKGSHSRIGIFVLIIWSIYYLMGFYIFWFHDTPKNDELYRACGIMAVVVAMWTAALGAMWYEYNYDPDRIEYERSRSGVVVGGIMLIVFLIVGMLMYARMHPKY